MTVAGKFAITRDEIVSNPYAAATKVVERAQRLRLIFATGTTYANDEGYVCAVGALSALFVHNDHPDLNDGKLGAETTNLMVDEDNFRSGLVLLGTYLADHIDDITFDEVQTIEAGFEDYAVLSETRDYVNTSSPFYDFGEYIRTLGVNDDYEEEE